MLYSIYIYNIHDIFCLYLGLIECFHNVILKYAPKRKHFSYGVMKGNTQLAIIDHNESVLERKQAVTKDGLCVIYYCCLM